PSPCDGFPALWTLLEACRDGVRLTRSGYLPTALVRELVELLPARADVPDGSRGESRCPPVSTLRYLATDLGLVQREGNRLVLTESAGERTEDVDTMVKSVGEDLVAKDFSVGGVIE